MRTTVIPDGNPRLSPQGSGIVDVVIQRIRILLALRDKCLMDAHRTVNSALCVEFHANLQLRATEARLNRMDIFRVRHSHAHEGRLEHLLLELVAILSQPDDRIVGITVPPLQALHLPDIDVVQLLEAGWENQRIIEF